MFKIADELLEDNQVSDELAAELKRRDGFI
jgi:hypothetical protein